MGCVGCGSLTKHNLSLQRHDILSFHLSIRVKAAAFSRPNKTNEQK